MPDAEQYADLGRLLADLTEGELSTEGRQALGELLRHDEQALAIYREYMTVHAALDWKLRPAKAYLKEAQAVSPDPLTNPRQQSWLDRASRHSTVSSCWQHPGVPRTSGCRCQHGP